MKINQLLPGYQHQWNDYIEKECRRYGIPVEALLESEVRFDYNFNPGGTHRIFISTTTKPTYDDGGERPLLRLVIYNPEYSPNSMFVGMLA